MSATLHLFSFSPHGSQALLHTRSRHLMLLHTAAQHPRLVQQVGYHQHAPATTLKFKSDAYTHPSTPPSTDGRDVKGASSGWYSRGFAGHVKGLQWQCWSVLLPRRHLPVQHQVHSTTLCSTPSPSVRTQDSHIKILNHCCLSEHQPSLGCHWKYPATGVNIPNAFKAC